MTHSTSFWIGFNLAILALIVLDLVFFHRKDVVPSFKSSLIWSLGWLAIAAAFNCFVFYSLGSKAGFEFMTVYLIERCLSMDNIFAVLIIMSHLKIPRNKQYPLLMSAVIGAALMRGLLIVLGVSLVSRYIWLTYIFGAFLLATGVKLLIASSSKETNNEESPWITMLTRRFSFVTPTILALIAIMIGDVIFAIDSIPAAFAISTDSFVIYTANIFSILGLTAMYFLLADLIHRFHYLKQGLATILLFIGAKMLIAGFYHIPILPSLLIIMLILIIAIIFSMIQDKKINITS